MKKVLLMLILMSDLFVINNFVFSEEVLKSSEPVEINEVYIANETTVRKSFITYEELLNDIDLFVYYVNTGYVGYDFMKQKGYDENNFKLFFSEKYKNQTEINTKDVAFDIANQLSGFVTDRHFSIHGSFGSGAINLCESALFFYTNTFVEKKGSEYFVFETDISTLKLGEQYTGTEENLFYYPAKGKNIYRLGVISHDKQEKFDFKFENKTVPLKVFDDGCISWTPLMKYHEIETVDSVYISLSSFVLPEKKSKFRKGGVIVLEKFANIGNKWRNKKNIIIDLRSNTGGRDLYGEHAVWSFTNSKEIPLSEKSHEKMGNFICENYLKYTVVTSPTTIQAHLKLFDTTGELETKYGKEMLKSWKKNSKNPKKNIYVKKDANQTTVKMFFNGNIIFIIDRNSMSASENTVFMAKKMLGEDKVKIIGEKSAGCAEYWDIMNYLLPNSKMSVLLGSRRNEYLQDFSQWHGDCYGIYPDYWSIGNDLNETIFLVTKDNEMKLKLSDIANRLM